MAYRKSEHKNAIVKMVKEKRMILQMDLATILNKKNINYSVESLVKEGKLKRQKVKNRGKVGNLTDVWLLYRNDIKQDEILEYEKQLINKPFNSPLVTNHCYKSVESPVEAITKEDILKDEKRILELEQTTETELTVVANEVIPIYDNNNERIVNARELYEYLQVKDKFATWIKRRIEKYGFVENEDYFPLSQKCEGNNANRIEYYLKMDTAKEIAMVENNERGRYIRKYFIQIEKEYKAQNSIQPTSNIEVLKMVVSELENQNNRITNIESKLKLLAN